MRSLIQNAVSYFERRIEALGSFAIDSPGDAVVSGYSLPLTRSRRAAPSANYDRRQVGILYADIADYSRLSERDEEGTHRRLVESMKLMQAHIAENGGRVTHFAGDAILAEFTDAEMALNCAINVQHRDRQKNIGLSNHDRILFRIGVNFGDVIADQGGIFGNAVILAARLEKLAYIGGICVSESVRNRLKRHPSYSFVAMGKQYVKNISEPVEVFWIEFNAEANKPVDRSRLAGASLLAPWVNISGYRDRRYSQRSSDFLKQAEFQGGFK